MINWGKQRTTFSLNSKCGFFGEFCLVSFFIQYLSLNILKKFKNALVAVVLPQNI